MSPIDRGIYLIGHILDSVSVTYLGVSTKESLNKVLNQLRATKYKITSKVGDKKTKNDDEQEM